MSQNHTKAPGAPAPSRSAADNPHSSGIALPSVVSFQMRKEIEPPMKTCLPFQPSGAEETIRPSQTVQFVIKTPGMVVNSPAQDDDIRVKKAILSEQNYLMKNEADLKNVRNGTFENIPMLPPFKHLIAERHDESRFTEAITDWGWGADHMVERFSENEHMADTAGDEERIDKESPYYGGLPLEDTIAKDLSSIAFATGFVFELLPIAKTIEDTAQQNGRALPAEGTPLSDTDTDPAMTIIRNNINALIKITGATTEYIDRIVDVLVDLKGYLKAQNKENSADYAVLYDRRAIGIANEALTGIRAQAEAKKVYYCLSYSSLSILAGLSKKMTDFMTAILQTHDNEAAQNFNVSESVTSTIRTNNIASMNPIREHYMINNINNKLEIPGLVSLGRAHLDNVAANVSKAKAYNDYSLFEKATKADKVL